MRKIQSAVTRTGFTTSGNSSYNSIDEVDNDDSILIDSENTTTTIDINHTTTTAKMNTKTSLSRFYSNPHLVSLTSNHHHDETTGAHTHTDPHIHYGSVNASNTTKSTIVSTNNYPTNVKDAYIDTIKTHFFYLGLSSGSALQVLLILLPLLLLLPPPPLLLLLL